MEGLLGGLLPVFNQLGGGALNILVGKVAWKDSTFARILRLFTGGIVLGLLLGAIVGLLIGIVLVASAEKQVSIGSAIGAVFAFMMMASMTGAIFMPMGVMLLEAVS
jgi:hypothetical protein